MGLIHELLAAQQELDTKYTEHFKLERPMMDELFLALIVEIGEAANEWRKFKFWSEDRETRTEKLLEEYIDGLKFILSISNRIEFQPNEVSVPDKADHTEYGFVLNQFAVILFAVTSYQHLMFFYNWESVVSEYFALGYMLGFNENDIRTAFFAKHQVNFKRLSSGY